MFGLSPGEYEVRISQVGRRPLVVEHVIIRVGETTGIGSLKTDPQPVELSEVHVTALRRTVDPVHTTSGGTLDSSDYSALPSDRDYKSMIAVLPGVNVSYYGDAANVSGSTGAENVYYIDGVNVTSGLDAATGTSLPHNFIREVEVKAGGYEAEYGSALGGVINAVTYSGTNETHGEAFSYATTKSLAAHSKSFPDLREVNSASYDFGWRLSGPIRHEKLWYSVAYNPRIGHVDKEVGGLGIYRQRIVANVLAGKLTWAPATDANVEVSVFGDPTVLHQVARPPAATGNGLTATSNIDPYLTLAKRGGVTQSVRVFKPFGQRFIAEASGAHTKARGGFRAETALGAQSLYLDLVSDSLGGGVGLTDYWIDKRSSAALKATLLSYRHTASAGIEYEDTEVFRNHENNPPGVITRFDSTRYRVVYEHEIGTFHNRIPGAYIQDAWLAAKTLTFTLGLRWSEETLTGASGRVAQRFVGEWQPRAGVSWQFGTAGRQRIMSSFGRFYQRVPLALSSLNYVDGYFTVKTFDGDPRRSGSVLINSFDGTTYEADFARSIKGAKAENLDEITVGYEALLGTAAKLTVRATHRSLRSSFGFGIDYSHDPVFILGTPGQGELSFLPAPKRDYRSLELGAIGDLLGVSYRASYLLSRDWGNYSGLYNSDILGFGGPNNPIELSHREQARNSTGWLPNDRREVVKLSAAYTWRLGIMSGAVASWATGTPLNNFGASRDFSVLRPTFLAQRGSVGRTPSIWDINTRLSSPVPFASAAQGRVILDVLHFGNPQRVVVMDQAHFTAVDASGAQTNPNPNYLRPLVFQPPMTVRLGVEIGF